MAKYNITEKKEKEAAYRTLVNPQLMDEMKEKILDIIVMKKKYKDKDYSAKQLAEAPVQLPGYRNRIRFQRDNVQQAH